MPPIFIVGPARSGTELVRTILNQHRSVYICAETHWFEDLRPRLERLGDRPGALRQAAGELTALRHRSYGLADATGRAEEIDSLIADAEQGQSQGTPDALFAAFCSGEAQTRGRSTWGEKTPRHVFAIDRMLQAFPDARILCCIRDPRGAIASYRDWQNRWFDGQAVDDALAAAIKEEDRRVRRSYSLTVSSLLWRSAVTHARRAIDVHGAARIRAVRFEKLLGASEDEIRALATWLDLDFDPAMANIAVNNSSYVGAGAVAGIDPSIAARWRKRLTGEEVAWIEALTGGEMARWGYERERSGASVGTVARHLGALPFEVFRAASANRRRIGDIRGFVGSRLRGLQRSA